MTNLESAKKYKRILCLTNESKLCKIAYCIKNSKMDCSGDICSACEFFDFDKCVDYLLQEHKEQIKLKQWEYDLIKIDFSVCKDNYFKSSLICMELKKAGYFKGIKDTNVIVEDILDNCIIVSDDYDFGESE